MLFSYADKRMNWDVKLSTSSNFYPVRVGFSIRDANTGTTAYSEEHYCSYTSNNAHVDCIQRIDQQLSNSVTGGKGRFGYFLTDTTCPGKSHYEIYSDWEKLEDDYGDFDSSFSNRCPCKLSDAIITHVNFYSDNEIECYRSANPIIEPFSNSELTPRCCYDISRGALLPSGSSANGLNTIQRFQESSSEYVGDMAAYSSCCESNLPVMWCDKFLSRRPIGGCTDQSLGKKNFQQNLTYLTLVSSC